MAGIERMTGPTIATVPVRVRLESGVTAAKLLSQVQLQATDIVPHEQFGLSKIRRLGPGAEQACRFQSLLVVQPKEDVATSKESLLFHRNNESGEASAQDDDGFRQFNTYALMVVCHLRDNGMDVELSYNATVVPPAMASRLAQQFEQVLR